MKALLLVPFNAICAQRCGDKLLRWKEKVKLQIQRPQTILWWKMFEDRLGHMLLSRNAVVFYYKFFSIGSACYCT